MTAVAKLVPRGVHVRCGPLGKVLRGIAGEGAFRGKHAALARAAPSAAGYPPVAVLYDAENISANYLAQVVDAVGSMGERFMIRAFGPPSLMSSPP